MLLILNFICSYLSTREKYEKVLIQLKNVEVVAKYWFSKLIGSLTQIPTMKINKQKCKHQRKTPFFLLLRYQWHLYMTSGGVWWAKFGLIIRFRKKMLSPCPDFEESFCDESSLIIYFPINFRFWIFFCSNETLHCISNGVKIAFAVHDFS